MCSAAGLTGNNVDGGVARSGRRAEIVYYTVISLTPATRPTVRLVAAAAAESKMLARPNADALYLLAAASPSQTLANFCALFTLFTNKRR